MTRVQTESGTGSTPLGKGVPAKLTRDGHVCRRCVDGTKEGRAHMAATLRSK